MDYNEIPGITLKMIIDSGIIQADTMVYASINHQITGIINSDGSITLNHLHEPKTFAFPSGAARSIVKTSTNGWLFWKILDDGEFKNLSHFKSEYQKIQDKVQL